MSEQGKEQKQRRQSTSIIRLFQRIFDSQKKLVSEFLLQVWEARSNETALSAIDFERKVEALRKSFSAPNRRRSGFTRDEESNFEEDNFTFIEALEQSEVADRKEEGASIDFLANLDDFSQLIRTYSEKALDILENDQNDFSDDNV